MGVGVSPAVPPILRVATLGIDHVCPMAVKPLVQPVSLLRLGQPTFHLSVGTDGVVTSSA